MLTEENARTKWCPYSRLFTIAVVGRNEKESPVAYNRIHGDKDGEETYVMNHPGCRCIASDCMAWRHETRSVPSDHQPPMEWVETPTGRGYCGLAGEPR